LRDLEKSFFGAASGPLNHFRGVAREMALNGLKHAAWILQRFVLQGRRPYERRHQRRESLARLVFHALCTDRTRLLPRVLPTLAVILVDQPVERPFLYAPL